MITSFIHKGLRKFYESGDQSKINPNHAAKLKLILDLLEAAAEPEDMNFPGSGFHELKGADAGIYSVKVSGNWRLTFKLENERACLIDYLDYHRSKSHYS